MLYSLLLLLALTSPRQGINLYLHNDQIVAIPFGDPWRNFRGEEIEAIHDGAPIVGEILFPGKKLKLTKLQKRQVQAILRRAKKAPS